MGERAGSPCVGEPGRLSLDDSERFSEDKERLVCSKFDCFVILRKRELRFLLGDKERATYLRPDSRTLRLLPLQPLGLPTPLASPSPAITTSHQSKPKELALAVVAQWIEYWPAN